MWLCCHTHRAPCTVHRAPCHVTMCTPCTLPCNWQVQAARQVPDGGELRRHLPPHADGADHTARRHHQRSRPAHCPPTRTAPLGGLAGARAPRAIPHLCRPPCGRPRLITAAIAKRVLPRPPCSRAAPGAAAGLAIGNGCWGTVAGTNCGDVGGFPGTVYKIDAEFYAGRGLISQASAHAAHCHWSHWPPY